MDAIAFTAAGARGAFEIGAYERLVQEGLEPEVAVGTSAGAYLSTRVAAGDRPRDLREAWPEIARRDRAPQRLDLWRVGSWEGVRDPTPLLEHLQEAIDWEAVRGSPVRIRFPTVDVRTGEERVFDNATATPRSLLGALSIPFALPPAPWDGTALWDGGLSAHTAIRHAVRAGADEVYVVMTDPMEPVPHPIPSDPVAVVSRMVAILIRNRILRDLEELSREPVRFHVIAPEEPLEVAMLDFDPRHGPELFEGGRRAAERRLAQGTPPSR